MDGPSHESIPLGREWTARLEGGYLIARHRRRDCFAAAAAVITSVRWRPPWRRSRTGRVEILSGARKFRCPADEVAAARLRRLWRDALAARHQPPRGCGVDELTDDPVTHGGRRWISQVVLGVGPDGSTRIVEHEPEAADQELAGEPRLGAELCSEQVRRLVRPGSDWRLYAGTAFYTFEWDGPIARRRAGWRRVGVLAIDRFRPERAASRTTLDPDLPSNGTG